jgi:rubrerythrin
MSKKADKGSNDQLRLLKSQVRQLKQENQRLRKLIKRADWDTIHALDERLDQQRRDDDNKHKEASKKKNIREKWKCDSCGDGVLIIIKTSIAGIEKYFRRCDCCGKRTPLQPFNDDVTGILLDGTTI